MEQRRRNLIARLQPKQLLSTEATKAAEEEEEEEEEGDEEAAEEAEEGEEPIEKRQQAEKRRRMVEKPVRQLSLQQIRSKKRELLRLKRIGAVAANDTREYALSASLSSSSFLPFPLFPPCYQLPFPLYLFHLHAIIIQYQV